LWKHSLAFFFIFISSLYLNVILIYNLVST
jgi:hypothetical protein